jgi:hypothetical protein
MIMSRMTSLVSNLGVVAILAVLASGCTPEVNQHETDRDYEQALSSYELCRMRHHPVDQGTRCDSVARYGGGSQQWGPHGDPAGSPFTPYSPYSPYARGSADSVTQVILASTSEELDIMRAEWEKMSALADRPKADSSSSGLSSSEKVEGL